MAINQGAGPHTAFMIVNGAQFPVSEGSVDQNATRKSSTFSCTIPMNYPGAYDTLAALGKNTASILVSSAAGSGTLLTGQVDTVHVYFVDTKIVVSGRDQSAKLHSIKSSQTWINQPGSQIVQQLASQAGLSVQADTSPLMAGKYVNIDYARISDSISLAAVIHKLAEFDGARWWVSNGVLYYRINSSPAGIYTLNYVRPQPGPMQADFFHLDVRRNIPASGTINVTVKSWHPRQQKVFTGTATAGLGIGDTTNYEYHIPNLQQDHAQQHAQSKAQEHARHAHALAAEVVGDPSIDVAMGLQLNGTGYFDMMYQMDTIKHSFGMRGYRMSITARLPTGTGSGGGGGAAEPAPTLPALPAAPAGFSGPLP